MSALRLEALRGRGAAFSGWMAVLVALVALGAFAWTLELTGGLQRTGLSDYVPWGLYVAAYMFFLGAAAGGLLLASAGDAFEIGWLRPFARI
ncbi:MAG TPA: NrfD/PsrC family molybdoenzyme membrane anchor subunit, partial [Dehalococcoidia bacterium]|nr:NrfD/PsrC family molybdoenzyme membrane anchor subunit [Dehalococcoidia bacterium]